MAPTSFRATCGKIFEQIGINNTVNFPRYFFVMNRTLFVYSSIVIYKKNYQNAKSIICCKVETTRVLISKNLKRDFSFDEKRGINRLFWSKCHNKYKLVENWKALQFFQCLYIKFSICTCYFPAINAMKFKLVTEQISYFFIYFNFCLFYCETNGKEYWETQLIFF